MAVQKKGRDKQVTEGSGSLHKRGDGLGTGPVGSGGRTEGTHAPQEKVSSASQQPSQGRPSSVSQAQQKTPRPQGTQGSRPQGASNQSDKGLLDDLFSTNTASSSSQQKPSQGTQLSSSSSSGGGMFGGLSKLLVPALIILFLLFVVRPMLCGNGGSNVIPTQTTQNTQPVQTFNVGEAVQGNDLSSVLSSLGLSSFLGGSGTGSYNTSSGLQTSGTWAAGKNTGVLNTSVSKDAAKKRTKILGNGKDVMTIMVYMCGTDLESKYSMGTSDLQEMLAASSNDNLNIIVYTGGCSKWQNSVVSSQNNMIFQIKNGKIYMLNDNVGQDSMVKPDTLTSFIKFCDTNFPANRNMLILWDHGGGSVTGYGYDEKYKKQGAMDLKSLDSALRNADVSFDIIGFDACLMATYETAFMASKYADYMVASEESEPGVGWYYTTWVSALANNTSLSSLEIGKNIVDSFVTECNRKCPGQATTLSVVDLAEVAALDDDLEIFSGAVNTEVNNNYQQVASSRAASHEFAAGNRIDQVDLVDLASRINTTEAKDFTNKLLSAIKYNLTSSGVSNAYGLSVFWPNSSSKYVDTAVKIDRSIGLGETFIKLLQNYASMQVSGQATSNYALSQSLGSLLPSASDSSSYSLSPSGGSSLLSSGLLSLLGGGSNTSTSSMSSDLVGGLLGSLLGGGTSSQSSSSGLDISSLISGLTSSNTDFFSGRELDNDAAAAYIAAHLFDPANLNWKEDDSENLYIALPKEQWELVTDLALSMYYDDGEGFIDLGVDNVYSFDASGNLLAPQDADWLAVNGQLVAYYYETETWDGDDYVISGYIPALLNDELVRLIVTFDKDHPSGYIAGAQLVYRDGETEVQPKSLISLNEGDKIDFVADYYNYNGKYEDTYMIGDPLTVSGDLTISNVKVDAGHANMMYRLTDIYSAVYWSEALTN